MKTRRIFLKRTSIAALLGGFMTGRVEARPENIERKVNNPKVISTWEHGLPANEAAWKILSEGGRALDAVEAGVKIPEADPNVKTVGFGSYPDELGRLTLDACIMDERQQCGSVACLEHIKHPVSVARLVMEKTRHVMLVGEGALQFALTNGFERENLLTPEALTEWKVLKEELKSKRTIINIENHDTISMLAIDAQGNLSGACTTSGAAVKMHGRVGDSPIIGAGLFVDNEVGAACATGVGEEVIKQAGSAMVVEMMRQGRTPDQACREIVERIMRVNRGQTDLQVGFLALRKDGKIGSFAVRRGFNYAIYDEGGNRLVDCPAMPD